MSAADRIGPGYVTRGLLVDVPLMKKVKWLEPSTPIYAEDLEAWEKFAGIKIGAGDALLFAAGGGRRGPPTDRGRTAKAVRACMRRFCPGCARATCRSSPAMR